jgi:hypothetical protein
MGNEHLGKIQAAMEKVDLGKDKTAIHTAMQRVLQTLGRERSDVAVAACLFPVITILEAQLGIAATGPYAVAIIELLTRITGSMMAANKQEA